MTATIADAFASLSYAKRNPSWAEYERAAPCEQRAIVARWLAISKEPVTENNRDEGDSAWHNWHLAVVGCFHEDDPRRSQKPSRGLVLTGEYINDQPVSISLEDRDGE